MPASTKKSKPVEEEPLWKKRTKEISATEDYEELKKCLCPFFEKGGYPDCSACRRTESDIDECKSYYLERIVVAPMDLWTEDFDKFKVQSREAVSAEEIVGIGISCDNCYMYDKCPMYKRGFTCGIKWDADRPQNPSEFMDFLINTQYDRVKRAAVFEKVDGGVPDANLSSEMDRLHNLVASKIDMGRERFSLSVEATGRSDVSAGGGILAKIFGGSSSPAALPPEEQPMMIEAKTVEAEEVPVMVPRKMQK